VLSRMTSSVASSTRVCASDSPLASEMTMVAAVAAISVSGWWTVVSGGTVHWVGGRSSKPTTLRSRGMLRPASAAARYTPSACPSLQVKTAVGGSGSRSSSRPHRRPAAVP
jgi:hypothetical protein